MLERRGFLKGLASLPLIGGGVALIGRPTASAVPATQEILSAYDEWLFMERRFLCIEMYGAEYARRMERVVSCSTLAGDFHFLSEPGAWRRVPMPSTRAAVILSAAGVPLDGAA